MNALFRHELKGSYLFPKKLFSLHSWIFWVGVGFVIGLCAISLFDIDWHEALRNTWFFMIGFPFVAYGYSYQLLANEWDRQTFGWWLALPYPRTKLLMAKLYTGMLFTFVIYLLAGTLLILFYLYATWFHQQWSIEAFTQFLTRGGTGYLFLFGVASLMAMLGLNMATLVKTKWVWLCPVLFMSVLAVGSFFYYLVIGTDISLALLLGCFYLSSLVLTIVMIRFNIYLLNHKLNL